MNQPGPSLLGGEVPTLGQGTWQMGDRASDRSRELAALSRGLDLGMTLIDTAEIYGDGASERLVGEVIRGRRDRVVLVSKVHPRNAGARTMGRACDASLARLGTDRLDLYLLHWRGTVPLAETVDAFERLVADGRILRWGVSNFDVDDMEELLAAGGRNCATNQILYNPTRRGPEFELLPWMAARHMPVMAYSPVEQGRLPTGGAVKSIADRHGVSVAQVFLAFTTRSGGVVAIPKASSVQHVEDNRAAADLLLDAEDLAALDSQFPPPARKHPLDMI